MPAPNSSVVQCRRNKGLWGQAGLGPNSDSAAYKMRGLRQICSFSEPLVPLYIKWG